MSNDEISLTKALLILVGSITLLVLMFKGIGLIIKDDDTTTKKTQSSYSNYHKCEYSGCSNYASGTKYCSKHTTYSKCSKVGCSNSVSYSGARYCAKHELEMYYNR